MQLELKSAVNFLTHLLRLAATIEEYNLKLFHFHLTNELWRRYTKCWFVNKSMKGSAYRRIRLNGVRDPLLCKVARNSYICEDLLYRSFPSQLMLWVDPFEVSYRIGEFGSICVLYNSDSDVWTPGSDLSPVKESRRSMEQYLDPRKSKAVQALSKYV